VIKKSTVLDDIASLHNTHHDFDGVLAHYTGKIISPEVHGQRILEAGCSTGVMTSMFIDVVKEIDIVEGSEKYLNIVKEQFNGRVKNYYLSLFENFMPAEAYDGVVLANVLHHIEQPVELLRHMSKWIKKDGAIYISAPNMTSFHRELGVEMGLNKTVYETSERNIFFNQFGRFDQERLKSVVQESGLRVAECYGFFFKPFPHEVMNAINLKQEILDGLFQMGKKYPHLACQLFIKAKKI
jgi:2-polyprenyl-3-methyl-5-hydroxy-6-metoxy-1,4-benzoquinol methylase